MTTCNSYHSSSCDYYDYHYHYHVGGQLCIIHVRVSLYCVYYPWIITVCVHVLFMIINVLLCIDKGVKQTGAAPHYVITTTATTITTTTTITFTITITSPCNFTATFTLSFLLSLLLLLWLLLLLLLHTIIYTIPYYTMLEHTVVWYDILWYTITRYTVGVEQRGGQHVELVKYIICDYATAIW